MLHRTRREVLTDVGRGMFLASLGTSVAADIGLGTAFAADEPGHLTFGDLEPLVMFMQDTHPDKLLPRVVEKLQNGTDLKQLVAAASLANARAFGGEDYIGFHTLMALAPAFHMANEKSDPKRKPLAVLKVLYRNSNRLFATNFRGDHTLKPLPPTASAPVPNAERLRDQVRERNLSGAEQTFAALSNGSPDDALSALMVMVDDVTEVHRIVLVSRAWDLINFVGKERAHTMLRQSVHYCVKAEGNQNYVKQFSEIRTLLPQLLDQFKLIGRTLGSRPVDEAWIAKFSETLFTVKPAQAAEAVAAALAEGQTLDSIGESILLAANQLVLRDEGRPANQTSANKGVGSIHGDSIGVHACDSAHAWRNIAHNGDQRTQVSSLILAGYQVAKDRLERGGNFANWQPYPRSEHLEKVKSISPESLMKELDGAIRETNQARAAALVYRLGVEKHDAKDVFDLLRRYAVSEDGALHAEKYFRTATDDFNASRPAFKWRQLIALARVTASECGQPAPGYQEACALLKV